MTEKARARIRIMRDMAYKYTLGTMSVLELGPGPYPVVYRGDCKEYHSMDINPKHKPTIVGDVREGIPLKDRTVHLVIAGELLEHIERSKDFLDEISRVMGHHGILILSVPNFCYLGYRLDVLRGRIPGIAAKGDAFYDGLPEEGLPGHVRDYNLYELEKLLDSKDFILTRVRTQTPWVPVTWGRNLIVEAIRP